MASELRLDQDAYKVTKTTPARLLAEIIKNRLVAEGRCQTTSIGAESAYIVVKALSYLTVTCYTQFALFELKPSKPYPNAKSTTCIVAEIAVEKSNH